MASLRICSIPNCGNKVLARGWCNRHWLRWSRHGDPLAGGPPLSPKGAPIAWMQKHLRPDSDECLRWPFGLSSIGYPVLHENQRQRGAHNWACEEVFGPKPTDGHETAHSCGNRWCVNVRHLRWATQLENGDDKAVQCVHARGEQHPYAKLREAEVLTIYSLRGRASARGLAREYGVGTSAIASIWDGRSWSWLTGAPRVPHSHGKPLYSAARPHGPPKHGKRSGSSRLMSSTQQTT